MAQKRDSCSKVISEVSQSGLAGVVGDLGNGENCAGDTTPVGSGGTSTSGSGEESSPSPANPTSSQSPPSPSSPQPGPPAPSGATPPGPPPTQTPSSPGSSTGSGASQSSGSNIKSSSPSPNLNGASTTLSTAPLSSSTTTANPSSLDNTLSVVSIAEGSHGSYGTTVIVVNGVITTEAHGSTITLPPGYTMPSTTGGTLIYPSVPSASTNSATPSSSPSDPSQHSGASRSGPPMAAIVVPIIVALFLFCLGIFVVRKRRARSRWHPSQDYPFANPFAQITSAPDTTRFDSEELPAAPPKALQLMSSVAPSLGLAGKNARPLSISTSTASAPSAAPSLGTDAVVSSHMSFRSAGTTLNGFPIFPPLASQNPLPPLDSKATSGTLQVPNYRMLKEMRRNGEDISKARTGMTPPSTPPAAPTPEPGLFSDITQALDSANAQVALAKSGSLLSGTSSGASSRYHYRGRAV